MITETSITKFTTKVRESGQALENRKDLPILMMWNKDDNKLDYNIYKEFIKTFEKNGNDYKFYSYDTGGHDFNYDFIELL